MSASGRVSVTLPIDAIIADLGADNVNNNQVKSWRKDNKILQTFPFQAQIFETEAVENNRGQVIGVVLEKYNNIFESVFFCHTIQLAIKDALKVKLGQVSVAKDLDKCRNIATLVKRSESKGGKKRISKLYYMYK